MNLHPLVALTVPTIRPNGTRGILGKYDVALFDHDHANGPIVLGGVADLEKITVRPHAGYRTFRRVGSSSHTAGPGAWEFADDNGPQGIRFAHLVAIRGIGRCRPAYRASAGTPSGP